MLGTVAWSFDFTSCILWSSGFEGARAAQLLSLSHSLHSVLFSLNFQFCWQLCVQLDVSEQTAGTTMHLLMVKEKKSEEHEGASERLGT